MEWIRTRRREIILGGFYRTLDLHLRCSLQWVPVPFGPVLPFLSLLGRYSKLWGVWKTENWIMATFWSNLFFNTGHSLIIKLCIIVVKSLGRVWLFATPWAAAYQDHPWDFPGKSTGVGCHFLLQRSFSTQGLNPGLPHCKQTLYRLSHQGSLIVKYIVKYS